jgi:uncharacterized membrane protein YoaK (UPF0700 family)
MVPPPPREPSDDLRPPGSLTTALALAAVAGYSDAHIYLHVAQVFVANMSGNVVLFGMALGGRDRSGIVGSGLAIVAFVLGIAGATRIHRWYQRNRLVLRPDVVVLVELAAFVALIGFSIGYPDSPGAEPTARAYPILVAGGLAMGLQTAVLRRVGRVQVTTTYESGVVARFGEESVLALSGRGASRRPQAGADRVLGILGSLVVAYAAGAAAASAAGASVAVLALPVAVLGAVAVRLHLARPRPDRAAG